MLALLNAKVAENRDFQVPAGYKKVQDITIVDGHAAEPSLRESERIAMEIVDSILGD